MSSLSVVFSESQLPTEVPPIESYACLSDTSDSGLRWCTGDTVLPIVFGSCNEDYCVWPPDKAEQYKGQHLFPLSYQCHIQTGWSIEKMGAQWNVERIMEWFPASAVREYLEIQREIRLLTAVVANGRSTGGAKACTRERHRQGVSCAL
ncbi:MAG: hypothetical protein [Bacteriophage sp.]|nr:MAG: hypothetical protein [Bacteriophage sp.]